MLFAAREDEIRRFDAPGLPELFLGGLDVEAAGALLDDHMGVSLSREARERLIAGTGGNPLALLELPSTLSEPQFAGVEPLLEPLPVGVRVERAFAARVASLPDHTQTVLLVAAAEETGLLATILAAGAELGAPVEALDACSSARPWWLVSFLCVGRELPLRELLACETGGLAAG
jgi:hypothetical protein